MPQSKLRTAAADDLKHLEPKEAKRTEVEVSLRAAFLMRTLEKSNPSNDLRSHCTYPAATMSCKVVTLSFKLVYTVPSLTVDMSP